MRSSFRPVDVIETAGRSPGIAIEEAAARHDVEDNRDCPANRQVPNLRSIAGVYL